MKNEWEGVSETNETMIETDAGTGFEPVTSGLWAQRATRLLHPAIFYNHCFIIYFTFKELYKGKYYILNYQKVFKLFKNYLILLKIRL